MNDNPYVGPRTFTRKDRDRFFGREIEADDLLSLVIARRQVLFYAQSGAGKSSLLNTRLVPGLQEAGFSVLPTGRVSVGSPPGLDPVNNIFIFNLMLNLDRQTDPHRLTGLTLSDFLARLTAEDDEHYYYDDTLVEFDESEAVPDEEERYVLIIDQFEEIVTTHLEHWEKRADFFQQLDHAIAANPSLWVVLIIREDYIAALEPYAHLMSDKLRTRFYMQRMGYQAALEAVQKPAKLRNRSFADGVAEKLVNNLCQIRIPGQTDTSSGQFVEPVQLQVVCYQLWENLKGQSDDTITKQDLKESGDVDAALAKFYEQTVRETLEKFKKEGVIEIALRDWFENHVITEAGTRGIVYRGEEQTGGLPTSTIDFVASKFLLRPDVRTGDTWYELVHDRFVQPILDTNNDWRADQPLIKFAREWKNSQNSDEKLLDGRQLTNFLDTDWQALGPLVKEFVEASQEAQQQATQATKRRKIILAISVALALIMTMLACVGWNLANLARKSAATAQAASTTAIQQEATAQAAKEQFNNQQFIAREHQATSQSASTRAIEQEAEAEAARELAVELQATLEVNLVAILTLQAPAPTSTATPTPQSNITVTLAASTNTPTTTRTPTPDRAATATVEAVEKQLEQVRATQTAVIQTTQEAMAQATQTAVAKVSFPPSGRIVFASNRSSDPGDLYVINGDGSSITQLTSNGAIEPDYSSAINKIVFTGLRMVNNTERAWLYLIDLDGGPEMNVGGQEYDNSEPSFSPDGQRIAFASTRDDNSEIYVMNIDGSNTIRLTNDPANDQLPAWSPDGKRIAFVSDRTGQTDIWLMDTNGEDLIQLTNHPDADTNPTWSPDSQQIAFAANRNGNFDIYVMDVTGSSQQNLTNSPFDEDFPAWSFDGKWLAFSRFTTNVEIFVMTIDGDHLTNLTNNIATDWWPAWIP